MKEKYDSTEDTEKHISLVQQLGEDVLDRFYARLMSHDCTKLLPPEKETFDEFTPKLQNSTYGSDEYKDFLTGMKPALNHHYKNNRHHPEHFDDGINGMNLIDMLEMLCDWKAATKRHADGDIMKSIEINQKRFGYSDEIKQLLLRTIGYMGWKIN